MTNLRSSLIRIKDVNTVFLFFMSANSFFFVHEFATNIARHFVPMNVHHMTTVTSNIFEFCTFYVAKIPTGAYLKNNPGRDTVDTLNFVIFKEIGSLVPKVLRASA